MAEKTKASIAPELRAAVARFSRWRARRPQGGRIRIPDSLWAAAVRAARACNVNRTARALGLSHTALAARCGATIPAPAPASPASFVEIPPTQAASARECLVEVEPPGGGRVRIRLGGITPTELAALTAALLKTGP
jgi:hypothetical protein